MICFHLPFNLITFTKNNHRKKCTFIYFIAVLFTAHNYAQQTGTILPKRPSPKAGVENLYEYQPAAGFTVPEKPSASVLIKKGISFLWAKAAVTFP